MMPESIAWVGVPDIEESIVEVGNVVDPWEKMPINQEAKHFPISGVSNVD